MLHTLVWCCNQLILSIKYYTASWEIMVMIFRTWKISFSRLRKIKKVMEINQFIVGPGKSRKFIVC